MDHVVDRYLARVATANGYTLRDFFAENPLLDQSSHLVPLVVAEIQRRLKTGLHPAPRSFFDDFEQLAQLPEAWRVLDVAEPWLSKHEGQQWAEAWRTDFPEIVSRFLSPEPNDSETSTVDVDLDNLQPGDRVVGFEILRFIGSGTFGRVYLANDLALLRQCALKVAVDQGSEGQVLAKLDHKCIVNIYREQCLRSRKLLAMQFVNGGSLAEWIQKQNSVRPEKQGRQHVALGVELIRQMAGALQHAHTRGVLHRDIKPANILLDTDCNPMLSDFNVASTGDAGSRFLVGGTINYMSPEQLRAFCLGDTDAESDVDTRSDVYSLGVVLLEILTGQKSWGVSKADSQHAAANQLLASRVRTGPPSIVNSPGVTASLAAIVDKALQPIPEHRYQSAAELETDLGQWLEDRDNIYAANPSPFERVRRHLKHYRKIWLGAIITSCVFLTLLLINYRVSSQQLAHCEQMTAEISELLTVRKIPTASETLGNAKAQFLQAGLARWMHPSRYAFVEQSLGHASRQILIAETTRFSTQFGEIVLTDLHEHERETPSQLIKNTLETYNVLSSPEWQHESPFSDLDATRKRSVARQITELMLVSMVRSSEQASPSTDQINRVLERLPMEHRTLSIFKQLQSDEGLSLTKVQPDETRDAFESYLLGVLSTLDQNHQSAKLYYRAALRGDHGADFWNHYRLAFTCEKLECYEEAFIHYGTCIGLQPEFSWPKFNLGLVCLKSNRPELAATFIAQAISDDPSFTAAYVALMAIHIQQKAFEKALEVYRLAESNAISSPELESNYKLAVSRIPK